MLLAFYRPAIVDSEQYKTVNFTKNNEFPSSIIYDKIT
jgi:hypothetical protein